MSTTFPYPLPRPYHLEGSFQERQDLMTPFGPLSMDEQDLLINKLGARGYGRVLLFSQYYGSGWGEGNKQVSPKGQASLLRFLEKVDFRSGADPSVFLTDEGALELAWVDTHGNPVQLAFGSQGIEVYHETAGRDEVVPVTEYEQLAIAFSNV